MTGYLENSTPINVIPDYVQNFAEASSYLIESIDQDFFSVIESMGLVNEDGAIDESAEVVTEGVKEVADKFIGALRTMWAKIQGWFKQVSEWFDKQKETAKKHFNDIIKKASDATIGKIDVSMLDGVSDDKKVGTYTKFNIPLRKVGDTPGILDKYAAVGKAIAIASKNIESGEGVEFNIADAMEAYRDAFGSNDGGNIAKSVRDDMTTSTIKNATVGQIKSDFADIKAVVFGNDDKSTLKAAYTSQKDAIDKAIKAINSMKTHGLKKSSADKANNVALAKAAAFFKKCNTSLHIYHSAVVGLMRARFAQYASIISRCVALAIAAKAKAKMSKKKAANESVTLESLFEW